MFIPMKGEGCMSLKSIALSNHREPKSKQVNGIFWEDTANHSQSMTKISSHDRFYMAFHWKCPAAELYFSRLMRK